MSAENGKADVANIENITTASEPHFDLTLEKVNIKQGDDALQFTIENGSINWTKEEERAVLWKIDLRLVPLVSWYLLTFFCFADSIRCWVHRSCYTAIPRAMGLQQFSK
jgi:hypothetical protein